MGIQKSGAAPAVVPFGSGGGLRQSFGARVDDGHRPLHVGADARIRPERLPPPQAGMASPLHPQQQKKSPLPNVSARGFLWCAVQDSNL